MYSEIEFIVLVNESLCTQQQLIHEHRIHTKDCFGMQAVVKLATENYIWLFLYKNICTKNAVVCSVYIVNNYIN